MKRIVGVLLIICLLFGMAGCGSSYRDRLIDLLTSEPTEEIKIAKPENVEYPFAFDLTDGDVDEFYQLLEESEEIALAGTDPEKVDEITDQLSAQYEYLEDQCMIAQIIYYCDMSDEAASRQYLDCVDILSQANNAYMEMVRRIYQSDSPAKEMLFEGWTQQELDMLMAYTDEIMNLEKRNSEILVEYQALADTASDEMIPLYREQVQNNNRIARIYGYENYYDYAYEIVYGRDYDISQLALMRQYVAEYLSPVYENAYYAFSDTYGTLGFVDQMKLSAFMTNSYDDCGEEYLMNYMGSLPEEVSQGMLDAIEGGNAYFAASENAFEGAFTTTVGDASFCFFGPGYTNSMTVAHELGHYYGSQFSDLSVMPLDLAETQSQGNEWLFLSHLSTQMDEALYDAIVNYKLYNDLSTILVCVLVDEFEQRIYSEPDLASFTAEDFNRVMEEVCAGYGGLEYIEYWVTDIQSYWRYVVVESPVYYMSYGVSAIAAMNLYTIYQEDAQTAIDAYRSLTEGDGSDKGFLEVISQAGLPGPFDESVYAELAEIYS